MTVVPTVLMTALEAALEGTGAAVVPGASAPGRPIPPGVAVVLTTSGSTSGTGRAVALSARALRASAVATHDRLGGPGQWLLALPIDHVAGLQVLVRSVVAGTRPVVAPAGHFDPRSLTALIRTMRTDVPRYLSLVPTQLVRTLAADAEAVRALRECTAVLVGGAATPAAVLEEARDRGVPVVNTYGMTETCGGCVYDGVPLEGVDVRVDEGGRIHLAGDVLAAGYLDDDDDDDDDGGAFVEHEGRRWFRTPDAGTFDAGTLHVLGRVDDVVVTGGVNVHPLDVERTLAAVETVGEMVVVGVPDQEWGQLLTAVVVPRTGRAAPTLTRLREAAGHGAHAPRALVVVGHLALRGPGKVDRRAAAALAAAALARGEGERY